jgi:hypothetical protein
MLRSMASDILVGGMLLFFELNAAFVVFLLLIPPSRKATKWLRDGRKLRNSVTLADSLRLVLYIVAFLVLLGPVIGVVTGVWYPQLLLVWWLVVILTPLMQVDVWVLQSFFIAIVLVWMSYVLLYNRAKTSQVAHRIQLTPAQYFGRIRES